MLGFSLPFATLIVGPALVPLFFSLGSISFILMLVCGTTWMVSARIKTKQEALAHALIPIAEGAGAWNAIGNPGHQRTQQLSRAFLTPTLLVMGFLLLGGSVYGADLSEYRGFKLGSTVANAAKVAGISPSEADTLYERPELIQELEWRPELTSRTDPVKDGQLHFFNGKLYRIVSNYDRYKVEGLSAEDMVASISRTYGPATTPDAEVPYTSIFGKLSAPVIGRWEDPDHEFNLVQAEHSAGFALIITDKNIEALARAAIIESIRLEVEAAPLRAIEMRKQREQDELLRLDEVRSVNQENFRP